MVKLVQASRYIFRLALLVTPSLICAAPNNECSVLDGPGASDLAIDNPERFEELSRRCSNIKIKKADHIQENGVLKSSDNSQITQKHQAKNMSASGKTSSEGSKPSDDSTKGCPFLEITEYGLTHPQGSTFCWSGSTIRCVMKGKNSKGDFYYGWENVYDDYCPTNIQSPHITEYNKTRYHDALKNSEKQDE